MATTTQKTTWDPKLYNEKHSFVWKLAGGLLELLAPKSGERILDLGCGTGHLTSQIAATGAMVTGVDASADMVREAREKYPDLRFEVADARNLQLAETFDAVFSNATLHWVHEAGLAAAGIARHLKPGGRFVAEFGGKGNIENLVRVIRAASKTLGLSQLDEVNPWYYPSIAEYAYVLETNGLEVTQAFLFDRPTPLEDGEQGLAIWLRMFTGAFLSRIPAEQQASFIQEVERQSRPSLFHDGGWILDYRRIRIVACKRAGTTQ